MKHLPFQSNYRTNFEVVEKRIGRERFYPHHDQLPILWRALDIEFKNGLPPRLTRTDRRADGFHKYLRKSAALLFCAGMNSARPDGVRLMALPDEDMVAQVTVVQQITRETRLGLAHQFRFYGGPDFQPEVRLSGKRMVLSEHALQRYSERVPRNTGAALADLLLTLYGSPILSMPLAAGRALVVSIGKSMVAFPYKESADEFFLLTCLTAQEVNHLKVTAPPLAYNWHYGAAFTLPKVRHWVPTEAEWALFQAWQRQTHPPQPLRPMPQKHWPKLGAVLKEVAMMGGHGPGTRMEFLDNIPGPQLIAAKPGEKLLEYDELAEYKRVQPEESWDTIFAQRDSYACGECLTEAFQP